MTLAESSSAKQMTPRDLRNVHATRNSGRDTLPTFCATQHYNYPNIFTFWWRSLLVVTSKYCLLTRMQYNATRKHWCIYPQGERSGLRNSKMISSTLITVATSIHLPKLVSNALTIKLNSVLTNPVDAN